MITLSAADFFALSQEKTLIVQLPSFDWDLRPGFDVRLRAGERSFDARQIGVGSVAGKATLKLRPADWAAAQELLTFAGPILLEKRQR